MVICHILAHATTWQTTVICASVCKAFDLSGQNLCHEFVTEHRLSQTLLIAHWTNTTLATVMSK